MQTGSRVAGTDGQCGEVKSDIKSDGDELNHFQRRRNDGDGDCASKKKDMLYFLALCPSIENGKTASFIPD